MKRNKELATDGYKKLKKWKDNEIREFKKLLRREILSLGLSNELLFLFPNKLGTDYDFNNRLNDIASRFTVVEDNETTTVFTRSKYEKILYEAVKYCLQPLRMPVHTWDELKKGISEKQGATVSITKEFLEIAGQIINNTNPKKVDVTNLSNGQREWLSTHGTGIETIDDIFYMMQWEYLTASHNINESKYYLMSNWLKKNHPYLYKFYLSGRNRKGKLIRSYPSMRARLKTLDKMVRDRQIDPLMIEIAIQHFISLLNNDILFASVFDSYFFKRRRGKPRDFKRKALDQAKPFIYYLKFFEYKPILFKNTSVTSIYDIGVLLLNALAGETIYSTKKYCIKLNGCEESGLDGRYFNFWGALQLSKELDSFRKGWMELSDS